MAGNPKLTVDIMANTTKASASLGKFAKKGDTAAKKAGVSWSKVGMAATAVVGAVAGVAAVGNELVNTAGDLNELLAQTQSLGVAQERVDELKSSVQDLAIETGRGTDDIAAGLYQVVSALGDSAESMGVLSIAAKLATAGVGETGASIELLTGVAKGYGDTSAEMIQHIADLSFQTIKLGVTDLPQLAASFGKVTGVAAPLGVELEELYAILATTTGQGKTTTEVVTSMESALSTFLKPAKKASYAIEQMGYASGEAMVQELGMVGALQQMTKFAKENGHTMAELMGRKEGAWLATVLLGDQYDTFLEKQKAMTTAAGAQTDAFEAMTTGADAAGFQQNQLNQRWTVAKQKMGDMIIDSGLVEKAQDGLTIAVDWLTDALDGENETFNDITGMIRDMMPVLRDALDLYLEFNSAVRSYGDWNYESFDVMQRAIGIDREHRTDYAGQGALPAVREYMQDPTGGQFTPHMFREGSGNRGSSQVQPIYVQVVGGESMGLNERVAY